MRFTRISLAHWRNFTRLDTVLQQRMFLIGPNASGKSNFLDCFRFLAEIVSVGGGFQSAINRRGGVRMIRSLLAMGDPPVSIRVQLGSEDTANEWTYELEFGQDDDRRARIVRELVARDEEIIVERPDDEDRADPERLRQTYLEQTSTNRKFRVVAKFFAGVRCPHLFPQLVREQFESISETSDPFGGNFLEQIIETPEVVPQSRLRGIVEALKTAVPFLEEVELTVDGRGVPQLSGKHKNWRPQVGWHSEEHLSHGTLRLLGLLWAVTESAGPLLLEEPELSLHPEVVKEIPQMFARVQRRSGRQVLVSSHSPQLLGDPGIADDEVLVLLPGPAGTVARLFSDMEESRNMRAAGLDVGEILWRLDHSFGERSDRAGTGGQRGSVRGRGSD